MMLHSCTLAAAILLCCCGSLVGITLEGSATSYAQFHPWKGGANSSVDLEFRTEQRHALLLYTDNSVTGEYFQLSLVDGALRLRYNWGDGRYGMLTAGSGLSSKEAWHHALILNSGTRETTLVVDRVQRGRSAFKDSRGRPSAATATNKAGGGGPEAAANHFANVSSNSYVFVGGLPSWYAEKSGKLVLPTVLLEPRLRGGVRKVRYRSAAQDNENMQEMMAYKVSRAFLSRAFSVFLLCFIYVAFYPYSCV